MSVKKYMGLDDMASLNASKVLSVIQQSGKISRREITERLGLSWGGMTKIVNKILDRGFIVEEKCLDTSGSGRVPSLLSINTEKNFLVGVDINKTGFCAIVVDLALNVKNQFSSNVSSLSKDGFLNEIYSFLDTVTLEYKGNIAAFGIAMQGIVDSENGVSVKHPTIEGFENIPLKNLISKRFGAEVFLEHDPDCLLYPHINKKSANTVLLRIDESVGMALSIGGRIIKGTGIFEIAHTTVFPDGKTCLCGKKGCLEAYIKNSKNDPSSFIKAIEITLRNLKEVFVADKIILTGTKNEILKEALSLPFVEFAPHTTAEWGAVRIAFDKFIEAFSL